MMKEAMPSESVLLVLGPPGVGKLEYMLDSTKYFMARGEKVVFVAVDVPPVHVRKAANRMRFSIEVAEDRQFCFVDCYTSSTGQEAYDGDKILHVSSLTNIEQIGMSVVKAANRLGKPLRIFFYTASPLYLYNSNQAVSRFFQVMTSQARTKLGSLTFALHGGVHDNMTVEMLKMFSDGVVELNFDKDMRRWKRIQYFKGLTVDTRWREFSIVDGAFALHPEKPVLPRVALIAEPPPPI